MARLRQPRSVEKRGAGPPGGRGRDPGRYVEPVDLREGDRPRRRLRRADRRRRALGRPRSRRAVRGARDPRHPGRRRRAEFGLRADAAARRLHLDRGLAVSGDADARDDRGGAASVAQHRPAQPDGEGAGDKAGPAGDPHADRRGHQRQRHAAVFAEGLRGGRRGLYLRPRGFRREGRRPAQGRERRELLRQPHRHAGRRGARQDASPRPPTRPRSSGLPGSRARWRSPTPSSPISSTSASPATSAGSASRRRGRRRSACCGPAPAPRTRPTATCSMSRS